MKSLNKTLSLVLVLVMVLGLFGIAGAAFTDQNKIENTEAVNTMTALNIINGMGDGTFNPAGNVTRAEMAKMICVALNGGKEPVLSTSTNPMFSDIGGHWGQKYIEYCASLGIIAGMGDGTFAPNANVTGSQAAKMMLVAMNYKASVFGFEGANWEVNVNVSANKAGLYADLSIDASAAISRDNAAQLIYNGINAPNMVRGWTQNPTTGEITETYQLGGDTTSIAVTKFDLKTTYVTLGDVKYDAVDKEYDVTCTYVSGTNMPSATTFSCATDYSSLYGMNVKVLWTTDKAGDEVVYGVYAHKSSVIMSGVVGQLSEATFDTGNIATATAFTLNGTTYKVDSGKTLPAVALYDFNNNGSASTLGAFYTAVTTDPAQSYKAAFAFKALDTNGDNRIDKVVVYPFSVHKVTYVGTDEATMTTATACMAVNDTAIDLEEDVVYTGIAKNDWVKKTDKANTVSGDDTFEKITAMSGAVTKETVSNGFTKSMISGIYFVNLVPVSGSNMTVGSTYENIIQVNTFAFYAELAATSATAEDYAVMIAGRTDTSYTPNVEKAKLLFADGTVKEVDTAKIYKSGGADAAEVGGGVDVLVEYTKNSADKYTLNIATKTPGAYKAAVAAGSTYAVNAADDIGYILDGGAGGTKCVIADTAVVFAKVTGANSYKVITGAQLKTLSAVTNVKAAFYNENSSTGFRTIALAFVEYADTTTSSATGYGYMTENVAEIRDEDNNRLYEVTFWNGTENVIKTATKDVPADMRTKGTIFQYTTDSKGRMVVVPVTGLVLSKVTGIDGNNIQMTEGTTSSKISDTSTTVFYVNSKDSKGVAGGEIQVAGPDKNVYYVDGTGTNFKFIVFDMNNKMTSMAAVELASAPTQAAVTAALSSYNTVTVNGAFTTTDAFEVPEGKTLVVTGTTTLGAFACNVKGTLKTNVIADANIAQLALGAKGTLNITGIAATSAVAGQIEAITTVGAKVILATAILNANAADTGWYKADNTLIGAADIPAGTYVYTEDADGTANSGNNGWLKQ